MRVCHFREEVEVFDEVGRGVAKRSDDKHPFLVAECSGGRHNGVQVDTLDATCIDLVGFVVVEKNGCLEMLIPCHHLVLGHLRGRFRRAEAIETIDASQSVSQQGSRMHGCSYFDICCVDTLSPRHNKIIRPASATATSNLVLVRNIIIAFHGGNLDLADFQVTPPLGRSIVGIIVVNFTGESKVVVEEKGAGEHVVVLRIEEQSPRKEDFQDVVARLSEVKLIVAEETSGTALYIKSRPWGVAGAEKA